MTSTQFADVFPMLHVFNAFNDMKRLDHTAMLPHNDGITCVGWLLMSFQDDYSVPVNAARLCDCRTMDYTRIGTTTH